MRSKTFLEGDQRVCVFEPRLKNIEPLQVSAVRNSVSEVIATLRSACTYSGPMHAKLLLHLCLYPLKTLDLSVLSLKKGKQQL